MKLTHVTPARRPIFTSPDDAEVIPIRAIHLLLALAIPAAAAAAAWLVCWVAMEVHQWIH